jgi:hypothetical protein
MAWTWVKCNRKTDSTEACLIHMLNLPDHKTIISTKLSKTHEFVTSNPYTYKYIRYSYSCCNVCSIRNRNIWVEGVSSRGCHTFICMKDQQHQNPFLPAALSAEGLRPCNDNSSHPSHESHPTPTICNFCPIGTRSHWGSFVGGSARALPRSQTCACHPSSHALKKNPNYYNTIKIKNDLNNNSTHHALIAHYHKTIFLKLQTPQVLSEHTLVFVL